MTLQQIQLTCTALWPFLIPTQETFVRRWTSSSCFYCPIFFKLKPVKLCYIHLVDDILSVMASKRQHSSDVWNSFTPSEDGNYAICNQCNSKLKYVNHMEHLPLSTFFFFSDSENSAHPGYGALCGRVIAVAGCKCSELCWSTRNRMSCRSGSSVTWGCILMTEGKSALMVVNPNPNWCLQ